MTTVEIYADRGILTIFILMKYLVLYLFYDGLKGSSGIGWGIGLLAFMFVGIYLIKDLYLFIKWTPLLVLTNEGMLDYIYHFYSKEQFLYWAEINEIDFYRYRDVRPMITIQLNADSKVLDRCTTWQRKIFHKNNRGIPPWYYFNTSGLPMGPKKFVKFLNNFRSAALNNEAIVSAPWFPQKRQIRVKQSGEQVPNQKT